MPGLMMTVLNSSSISSFPVYVDHYIVTVPLYITLSSGLDWIQFNLNKSSSQFGMGIYYGEPVNSVTYRDISLDPSLA